MRGPGPKWFESHGASRTGFCTDVDPRGAHVAYDATYDDMGFMAGDDRRVSALAGVGPPTN
jgi:hypothetical protein